MWEVRIKGHFGRYEVRELLQKAASDAQLTKLSFYAMHVDEELILALLDLSCAQKKWDRLSIYRCYGDIERVLQILSAREVHFTSRDEFSRNKHGREQLSAIPLSPLLQKTNTCSLTTLELSNITLTEESGRSIAKLLQETTSIRSFTLREAHIPQEYFPMQFLGCHFLPSGISTLCMGLQSNDTLLTLKLLECPGWMDAHVAAVVASIHGHPCIQTLVLEDTYCRSETLFHLCRALSSPRTKLRELHIYHPRLDDRPQEDSFWNISVLVSVLCTSKVLQRLVLRDAQLQDSHLQQLVDMLSQNSTLLDLDLRFNQFSATAFSHILAPNLRHFRALQHLKLRQGPFAPVLPIAVTREALIQGLRHNWTLQSLDLFDWDAQLQYHLDLNISGRRALFQLDNHCHGEA